MLTEFLTEKTKENKMLSKLPEKYSLWLTPYPGSKAEDSLMRKMDEIRKKYKTPFFRPHVTLLGGIVDSKESVLVKTCELAMSCWPFDINLGEICSNGNGNPFQVLFYKVKKPEHLGRLNTLVQKDFGVKQSGYSPHLSLAYGDISKEDVSVLQQTLARDSSIVGTSFRVHGIELWKTPRILPEAVQYWERIAHFDFGTPDAQYA